MMNHNVLAACLVAVLGIVCWPSPRWQRLLLSGLALLARVGVLGTLTSLGITALWPESAPGSLASLVQDAGANNHLEPAFVCLLFAVLVACAAVPLLAGLDFARSLADDRAVSRALRAALNVLKQYDPMIDTTSIPLAFPPAAYRQPVLTQADNRRRLGDLVDR